MKTSNNKLLIEVNRTISFVQPKLYTTNVDKNALLIHGKYILKPKYEKNKLIGKFRTYEIELRVPQNFPDNGPLLWEVGGVIPREIDRHINGDGTCCTGVWDIWVIGKKENIFKSYFDGPLWDFFYSQYAFETQGEWPFGEREHGKQGLVDSISEFFKCQNSLSIVKNFLVLLSSDDLIPNLYCPCGSERIVENCCIEKIKNLKMHVTKDRAKKLLNMLETINYN